MWKLIAQSRSIYQRQNLCTLLKSASWISVASCWSHNTQINYQYFCEASSMNSPPCAPTHPAKSSHLLHIGSFFQSSHQLPIWLELREAQGRWHGFARDGQHLRRGPEGLGQGEARFQVLFTPVSVHKVPGGEGSASGGSGPTGRASHRSKV